MIDLSERQKQVCELLAKGFSDKEIAKELNLALPTVKSHIQSVKYVFRAKNRVSLVLAYLKEKGELNENTDK